MMTTEIKTLKEWGAQKGDKFRLVGISQDKGKCASWSTVIKWDFRIGVFQDDCIVAVTDAPQLGVHMDQGYLFALVSRADAKPKTPPQKTWIEMTPEDQGAIALHKLNGGEVEISSPEGRPKWAYSEFKKPLPSCCYRKKPAPPTKRQILYDKVAEVLADPAYNNKFDIRAGWLKSEEVGASRLAAVRAIILAEDEA